MAHITPKGCWRAQVRHYGRIVASKTFPRGASKTEAEAWEMRAKLEHLRKLPTDKGPMLRDFAETYFAEHAAIHLLPSTAMTKRAIVENHILPFFGDQKVGAIRPRHIAEFQAKLWSCGEGLSAQSVANIVSTLSQIFKCALLKDIVEVNPCSGITRARRARRQPTFGHSRSATVF